MKAAYTSNELFHLVGRRHPHDDQANYELLSKILTSGCVSHSPHENNWGNVSHTIDWNKSLVNGELLVPTVTCYADIPFGSLNIHVRKYGKFGLSFPREFLIQYGARPVMYVPLSYDDWNSGGGATLLNDLEVVYKGFYDLVLSKASPIGDTFSRKQRKKPGNEVEAIKAMGSIFAKEFLAFIKPFISHLEQNHPDNFYLEREWRKYANLKFTPDDVSKIVVAKGYLSRLKQEYPHYRSKIKEI